VEIEKILFQVFDDQESYGTMVLFFRNGASIQFRIKSVETGFVIQFNMVSNMAGDIKSSELKSFMDYVVPLKSIKINRKFYGVFTNIFPRFLKFKVQVRIDR
jgi:hypothetical protein